MTRHFVPEVARQGPGAVLLLCSFAVLGGNITVHHEGEQLSHLSRGLGLGDARVGNERDSASANADQMALKPAYRSRQKQNMGLTETDTFARTLVKSCCIHPEAAPAEEA